MSASSRGAGRFTKRDRRRATPRGRDPRADVGTGSRGSPAAITRASLRAGTGANPRRVRAEKSGVPRLLLAERDGAGGRSGGDDAWTRAWEETHLTSRWTQPSGTTRYARSVRGSLASAATIPIATLLGPGNEQADDRSETARHRNPMRSSSTAKPAQKKLTTSQRSPDWFSTIGLTRGAAEAPSHAGSRPTRPSVRRRDIPRAFVRYRSASDRRHVEGHAGEYPPMPATEVDPDFSPTNGSPSSTVNASCDWREPRVFEDRSGGTRAGARSFTQSIERPRRFCRHLRIVVASLPRFRRATRTGDRKSANPHLLAILFFRPGARTPDRRPTNPRAHLTATSLLPAINRLRAHRHRPTTNRR